MTDFNQHIVIDNGSYSIKAGFNGENVPRVVVPTVAGKMKNNISNFFFDDSKIFIGRECFLNSDYLNLNYPLESFGDINWELMEEIWLYIFFNHLKISPESHNVFLTENSFSNDKARDKIAQIMFENFNIFNIHIEPQGTMSLWSTAKSSGLVVESDHLHTEVIPIYEKFIISHGIRTSSIAGLFLTKEFETVLSRRFPKGVFSNNIKETARLVKEATCNLDCGDKKEYILPDGSKLEIGEERQIIPKAIFDPSIINIDEKGLDEMVYEAIMECDINIRKELASNIMLGGGNTLIPGFSEMLKNRVEARLGKHYEGVVKINSSRDRQYSVWTGSSVVCSISNFQHLWISKNDWEESGSNAFHKNYIL